MNARTEAVEHWHLEVAAGLVRMSPTRVRLYVRRGLVRPSRVEGRAIYLDEDALARLRKIRRLTEDLGLNVAGAEVALYLLDEIEALRAALRRQSELAADPEQVH